MAENEEILNKEIDPVKKFHFLIDFSKDDNLKEILYEFDKNYPDFSRKMVSERSFNKPEDASDFLRQNLLNFINDIYQNIKYKISESQKSGYKLSEIRIKSMSIPLKIKIFNANFTKKDLLLLLNIIQNCEKNLKDLEELIAKEIIEKEKKANENIKFLELLKNESKNNTINLNKPDIETKKEILPTNPVIIPEKIETK